MRLRRPEFTASGFALVWAAGVAVALLLPSDDLPSPPAWLPEVVAPFFDKILHFTLFGVTAWIFHRALRGKRGPLPLLGAVALAAAYGLLLEGLQTWVPGREPGIADGLANLAGCLAYAAAAVPRGVANRSRDRLRPPSMARSAGIRWALERAFSEQEAAVALGAANRAEIVRVASLLELLPRIACRRSFASLVEELGEEAAGAARRASALCAAQAMRLDRTLEEVHEVAAALGVRLALLKFAALEAGGFLRTGSRWAADLDVLASTADGERLQQELVTHGWIAATGADYEHQLPALARPGGGAIEIHRVLLGVRVPGGGSGRRSADFETLERGGLLELVAGRPSYSRPARPILLAHAVAHGWVQHVFEPATYCPMKMVADLVDLGLGLETTVTDWLAAKDWLGSAVPADELDALERLCRHLRAGEIAAQSSGDGSDHALDHILAGALDKGYAESLKLRRLAEPLSDAPRAVAVLRATRRALFPSTGELAAIHGTELDDPSLGRRRLLRPLDIARRTLRASGGWLESRRRNRPR